jgi:ribonuclease BN (tRNA processing enzyme)
MNSEYDKSFPRLLVLGSGDAFNSYGRNHSNYLLQGSGTSVLVDCGATILSALETNKIDHNSISEIIISHLHGDHYGGLPYLLLSGLYNQIRTTPLIIRGPRDTQERVKRLTELLYPGIWQKIYQLPITWVTYPTLESVQTKWGSFEAWPVNHSQAANPHGFKIFFEGKQVAFSGDTGWSENLILLAERADVFICECNFYTSSSSGHLNYIKLKEKLNQHTCSRIFLTHLSREMLDNPQANAFARLTDGMIIRL